MKFDIVLKSIKIIYLGVNVILGLKKEIQENKYGFKAMFVSGDYDPGIIIRV